MKKILVAIILLLFCIPTYAIEKPRVAVLDLQAEGISYSDSTAISGFLRTNLSNSDVLTVLERANMEGILGEQRLQMSGCTTSECAVKIGKILNVNKMVVGKIGKFTGEYYIEIRYVDVETCSIDFSESLEFTKLKGARKACKTLSNKIIDRIKSKIISYREAEEKLEGIDESKKGTLILSVDLPDVNIYIGSEDKGTIVDGKMELMLSCGKYQITAKKDKYYSMFTKEVIIYENDYTNINVELARKKGSIRINALNLADTKVYLDDEKKSRGMTGKNGVFVIKNINTGLRKIMLTKKKYHNYTDNIEVIHLGEVELKAEMEPNPGKIFIITEPPESSIYIDDVKIGQSDSKGIFKDEHIKANVLHTVKVSKSGYKDVIKKAQIGPEESKTLSFDLKKIVMQKRKPEKAYLTDAFSVWVSVDKANIRKGAGKQYGITFTTTKGKKLLVVDETGDWYLIHCLKGKGWIYKSLVTKRKKTKPIISADVKNGTKKWEFVTGFYVTSTPAIGMDGTIYVGSSDKKLYAINPDGTKKWEFLAGSHVESSPAIGSDGTIYVGSSERSSSNVRFYAINPDGTKKWEFSTGGNVFSSPAISSDGTIYIASNIGSRVNSSSPSNGRFYAINPDGTKKWRFRTGYNALFSPAIGSDGTIYIGSSNGRIYAINPDGKKKWKYEIGSESVLSSPAIGMDGTIYVGSHENSLYAINPDGTKKWEFSTGGNVGYFSPAIGSDGTIYIASSDNKLYAINPDGTKKWGFRAVGDVISSPAIGSVYSCETCHPFLLKVDHCLQFNSS